MDHSGKIEVATEIARRASARFGDAILFGALSASLAGGEDTAFSDLEVVFVTQRKIRLPGMARTDPSMCGRSSSLA